MTTTPFAATRPSRRSHPSRRSPPRVSLSLLGLFSMLALGGFFQPAAAQQITTPAINAAACAYNSVLPTLATGNFGLAQCDSTGHLLTTLSNTSATPLYVAGNESGTAPVQTATPANASHAAGQSVGGLFTIPMLRVAGGGGLLEYISIMSVGGDPAPLQVSVWDRKPTNSNFACTDNSAYADGSGSTGGTVGADQSHMLPGFPQSVTLAVPAQVTGDAKSYGVVTLSPPISVKNQDGTPSVNLYVCLKAASTYTPGGAAYYVNAIGPQD